MHINDTKLRLIDQYSNNTIVGVYDPETLASGERAPGMDLGGYVTDAGNGQSDIVARLVWVDVIREDGSHGRELIDMHDITIEVAA